MPFVFVERKKDYAIVTLKRDPVNAMNFEFWQDLQTTLSALESDPTIRGIVITSGLTRNVFTAGNDLTELYAPSTSYEQYSRFWLAQNIFLANLYVSRLVTVCAIRGACPAGGCAIALASDYRIMADTPGAHIGLNEPQIGLTVPELWAQLLVNTIGFRQAELLATNGAVVGPAEAKRVGLVDLVVPAGKEAGLVGTAETVLQEWLKLPSLGRSLTKLAIRKPLADKLRDVEVLNKQVDAGWVFLSNPNTIKVMKATLDRLQGSKL